LVEDQAHAFSGYIKENSNLLKMIEAVILKKCLLGFRVFVKPCTLFCIPLCVLPLIIKAQKWFGLVELSCIFVLCKPL